MSDFEGEERTLPFTEHNQGENVTVLLIHGAFSNDEEWNMVTPHLTNYHLLIPDLPGHGKASAIRPFSKHLAAKLIANTITQHAKDGKAHIIGLSLGAYIAIDLAVRYPAVVRDMFISGIKVLPILHGPLVPYLIEADTVHMRDIARTLNPETTAVVNLQIRHPWNRQKPELFAEAAKAWFEGREIPDDFRPL
ncbi:hypothetical protein BTJ68_04834 [Hortaea werneckii EXF-2000]|uniref:AB hydrolase-1 domain-containing protein n=1 Tax=Hortaea werneckii EXF-2000 TaxID=1157616 RepID=A0A1Z5TEP7_HORWE|nr:hypothetical protein BTJ68_04834 [Hortaea werneckii EXF-2000]